MEIIQEKLSSDEFRYLSAVLRDGEMPDLEGMWALMDVAWRECLCDPNVIDERMDNFYSHPVWLLNGLFIEQDDDSLNHRHDFTEYVASLNPDRVADFGGGFGSLARMIGLRCPDTEVHVVEPHPNAFAMSLAEEAVNVSYVPELSGEYDVLIATDVFEHVPDPLGAVEKTSASLSMGGHYLIANCFWPVMLCHLPSKFHFRWSWDAALKRMNLQPNKIVSYGRSFKRIGPVAAASARKIEKRSVRFFRLIEQTPSRYRKYILRVLFGKL